MRNYQVGILVNYYTDIRPESVRRVYIIYSLAAKAWFGNPLTIPNSDLASLTISSVEGLGPGG
jgi:hypothetical protein